jgi:tubulysin polyketide synthase-like protein
MMLMLLLTELTRLEAHLSSDTDGLHVQAPAGVLTDELRQAMIEHKAALLRYAASPYVETVDGRGTITGARRETDPFYYGTRHGERLRYKIGVRLLHDGVERFYLPGTLWEVRANDIQDNNHPQVLRPRCSDSRNVCLGIVR